MISNMPIDHMTAHAGQVLHSARAIQPYQNRGQDSFLIYHSIMVLWTYSMITSDQERRTGCNTPNPPTSSVRADHPGALVFLDDARSTNQNAVDSFVVMNTGIPCLRILSTDEGYIERADVCSLKHPSQVMQVGVALLDGTHPHVDRVTGPPLLRALCGLLEKLGGLQSA